MLVWNGSGGFHVFRILTDYISSVPLSWKMPFPVPNTKTVLLISGSEEKASFYCPLAKDTACFLNNVCRQIYSHTLGEGDGGVVCEETWVSQGFFCN